MARTESPWSTEVTFSTGEGTVDPPPVYPPNPGVGETDLAALESRGGYYENLSAVPVGGTESAIRSGTAYENVGSPSVIVDTPTYPGGTQKALKSTIFRHSTGYGHWGHMIEGNNPRTGKPAIIPIEEGGEVWFRQAVYYPSGFLWDATGGGVKFLRLFRARGDGQTTEGACELFIDGDGGLMFMNERISSPEPPAYKEYVTGNNTSKWMKTYGKLQRNQWHMVEFSVKFQRGGYPNATGEMRCWLDGTMVGMDTGETLSSDSRMAHNRHMMHTYWNDGSERSPPNNVSIKPPQTQHAFFNHTAFAMRGRNAFTGEYVDHTNIMARDGDGHPYIGLKVF